jgi:uncharacterized membrane protein
MNARRQGESPVIPLVILLLSLCGVGIAAYLTAVHYEQVPLLCSSSGLVDCQRVTSSAYSVVPGTSIPITIPGLVWALGSMVLALVEWLRPGQNRRVWVAHLAWSLLALVGALYLVYAEIVRLRTICVWCTGFHVIILIIFLLTMTRLVTSAGEREEYRYAKRGER